MIRKALVKDITGVANIYESIIEQEEAGEMCIGWQKGVYPTAATAQAALDRDDLFVLEDEGQIVAGAIINHIQVPEYEACRWVYTASDEEIMVLHTLVVNPESSKKGYGKQFVKFYEDYALQCGSRYLRMDTNEKNLTARNMYKKLGYMESGIVSCVFNGIEGVKLVCLEKKL